MNIEPAALTAKQAAQYIGIDTDTDALKSSRSVGILWGVPSPKFIKTSARKVLYLRSDLDEFLSQFERHSNNAQVQNGELEQG